jgi:hypothetical protein
MVDVLHRDVELVFVSLRIATTFIAAIDERP